MTARSRSEILFVQKQTRTAVYYRETSTYREHRRGFFSFISFFSLIGRKRKLLRMRAFFYLTMLLPLVCCTPEADDEKEAAEKVNEIELFPQ